MYNADGYAKDEAHVPFFSAQSWPRLLRYKKYQADSQANSASVCHGCRYSLKIRDHIDVLAGHLRTYIWQGGNYPAGLKNEAGNPDPKAGMEWCFEYGEEEWMNPFNVYSTSVVDGVPITISNGATFDDYFDEAKDDENLQISCN